MGLINSRKNIRERLVSSGANTRAGVKISIMICKHFSTFYQQFMLNANVSTEAKYSQRESLKTKNFPSYSYIMMKARFHLVELCYNVINRLSLGRLHSSILKNVHNMFLCESVSEHRV